MRRITISQSITLRNGQVNRYLSDINSCKLVNAQEEAILARKVKQGDTEAREKLIKANMRFVVSVAKQYQYSGIALEDLISAGNLGLMKAVDLFDNTKGFKLITYAVWWIRQSIIDFINDNEHTIRVPANISHAKVKTKDYCDRYFVKTGEMMNLSEAAQELGLRGGRFLNDFGRTNSISSPISNKEDSLTLEDILEDKSCDTPDNLIEEDTKRITRFVKKALGKRDGEIVLMAYGIGYPEAIPCYEISRRIGLTCERIRQILKNSIPILQKRVKKDKIQFV